MPDLVYGSMIFLKSRTIGQRVLTAYPGAIIGGTGWDMSVTVERWDPHARAGLLDLSRFPPIDRLHAARMPAELPFLCGTAKGRQSAPGTHNLGDLAWRTLATRDPPARQ